MKRFILVLTLSITLIITPMVAWADFPLRQSTASQEVPIGIMVDDTDGKTAETALTIANTDVRVWKAGATALVDKNSGGATHASGGVYYTVLDATDTNTLGPLVLFVHEAGALPERISCEVYPANVYDSLYSTDKLDVNVFTIEEDVPDTWYANNPIAVGLVNDAIQATKIQTDAFGADEFAAGAGTELGTANWATTTRVLTAGTNIGFPTAAEISGYTTIVHVPHTGVDATSGTNLRNAITAAGSNTVVKIGIGNYDIGATALTVPNFVSVAGVDRETSFISSSLASGHSIQPGNLSGIEKVTMRNTSTGDVFGIAGSTSNSNCVVRDSRIVGEAKGVAVTSSGPCLITLENVIMRPKTIGIHLTTGAHELRVSNVRMILFGASATAGIDIAASASVRGGNVSVSLPDAAAGQALKVAGTSKIELYDSQLYALTNSISLADTATALMLNGEFNRSLVTGVTAGLTDSFSPLRPTVAYRTADVTTTGGVGIDWANVENPTTTLNLSGTTTNLTLAQINSAIVTESGLQEIDIIAAIDAVPTAVWGVATRTITGGTITTNNDKTGYRLSATGVDDVWDELTTGHVTVGSFAELVGAIKTKSDFLPAFTAGSAGGVLIAGSNAATTFNTLTSTGAFTINGVSNVAQTGDSFARIGATGSGLTSLSSQTSVDGVPTNAEFDARTLVAASYATATALDTVDNFVDDEVGSIKTKTDFLPSFTAGAAGGVTIAGSNAATTFVSLTSTNAFSINGVSNVAQTGDSFARIGATGSGLTSLASQTSVDNVPTNTEFDARTLVAASYATASALDAVDNFVDTEVGAIKTVTDKLDTALILDGAVYQFTVNALELGPSGGGGVADWTNDEKEEIRHRLGLDGTATAPSTGVPSLATQASVDTIDNFVDTEIGTLQTSVTAVDDFVDTEVAAIKTKTDFLPSVTAGAAGGVFIAGTNAATTITGSLTTTFTGNLSGSVTGSVASIGNGGINLNTMQSGSITAAKFAAGAIDANAIANTAVEEIVNGIWDELVAPHTIPDTFGQRIGQIADSVSGTLAADLQNVNDNVLANGTAIAAVDLNVIATNNNVIDALNNTAQIMVDVGNVPTNAEFDARTLVAASYATATAVGTLQTTADDIPNTAEFNARTTLTANYATAAAVGALPTAAANRDALLAATYAGGAPNSVAELFGWQKATMAASGVFSVPALVNAPAGGGGGGGGGGLAFTGYVGTFDPDPEPFDIVQGDVKLVTLAIQAITAFADSTPESIVVKLKDENGDLITIPNAAITRDAELPAFQIFHFTLSAEDTAALAKGYITIQVQIDTEIVQIPEVIRVLQAL